MGFQFSSLWRLCQRLKIIDELLGGWNVVTALEGEKLSIDDLAPRISSLVARKAELQKARREVAHALK
ncbi:hypothetical protein ES703_38703 [subsurface metagenome]